MIRIREAQKHVDPVDPDSDPEHCFSGNFSYIYDFPAIIISFGKAKAIGLVGPVEEYRL
jgi:hypothetical protein